MKREKIMRSYTISSMRRLGSAQTAEYKDDGAKAGKVADVCDNL